MLDVPNQGVCHTIGLLESHDANDLVWMNQAAVYVNKQMLHEVRSMSRV